MVLPGCSLLPHVSMLLLQCLDTVCGGMPEDMGMTLATSEQLCTESSELDLAQI